MRRSIAETSEARDTTRRTPRTSRRKARVGISRADADRRGHGNAATNPRDNRDKAAWIQAPTEREHWCRHYLKSALEAEFRETSRGVSAILTAAAPTPSVTGGLDRKVSRYVFQK